MAIILLLALFSGYALVFMFSKKVEAIRLGEVETDFVDMPIFRHVEIGAETFYQKSKKGLKHAEMAVYHVMLIALQKIIPTYKNVSTKVETKLVHFTQMVKGRRMLHTERGASSLFLRDIREHKNNTQFSTPVVAPIITAVPEPVLEEKIAPAPKRRTRRVKVVSVKQEE